MKTKNWKQVRNNNKIHHQYELPQEELQQQQLQALSNLFCFFLLLF